MDSAEFESRLRERLAGRWSCATSVGLPLDVIERELHFIDAPIPENYKTFLRICGSNAGTLFAGYHWEVAKRKARNTELQLVSQEYGVKLPSGLFAFLDYIGDYFWCFFLNESADPEVHMFDLVELTSTDYCFSDFIVGWEQLDE